VHRKIVEAMREFDPDLAVFAGDALNCLPLGHMPDIGIAAYAVPAWPQYLRGHPEFSALTILPFPALLHDSVLAPLGPPRDECGFNEFLQTTAPMRLLDGVPLLFAPGNHDTYHKQDIRQIAALFGSPAGVAGTHPERLWFSADAGAWRFVVLYSGTDLAFDADPLAAGGAQLEWLEANLSEADRLGRRVAIAMHCPPFSSAKEDPPSPRLEKRVVRAILDRHRVDLVICGHQHAYERLERRGVTYVITGGAGGRFDEPVAAEDLDPHSEVFATGTHNFLRFEFATGGWTGEAVDVDGRVFDAFGPGIPSTAEIATR
jgi:Icc-related predicted phosphoesterase